MGGERPAFSSSSSLPHSLASFHLLWESRGGAGEGRPEPGSEGRGTRTQPARAADAPRWAEGRRAPSPGARRVGPAVPGRGRAGEGTAGARREPTPPARRPPPAGPASAPAVQSPVSLHRAPSPPLWLSPPAPSSAMVLR